MIASTDRIAKKLDTASEPHVAAARTTRARCGRVVALAGALLPAAPTTRSDFAPGWFFDLRRCIVNAALPARDRIDTPPPQRGNGLWKEEKERQEKVRTVGSRTPEVQRHHFRLDWALAILLVPCCLPHHRLSLSSYPSPLDSCCSLGYSYGSVSHFVALSFSLVGFQRACMLTNAAR